VEDSLEEDEDFYDDEDQHSYSYSKPNYNDPTQKESANFLPLKAQVSSREVSHAFFDK
jgi:hypothetical protein